VDLAVDTVGGIVDSPQIVLHDGDATL